MSKLSFYNRVTSIVEESRRQLVELRKTKAELEQDMKSGRYTPKHIHDVIKPDIEGKRLAIEAQKERTADAIRAALSDFSVEMRAADALNPADITDDVRLLNCGIKLTERDLRDMLERNGGNRTMEQLVLRYAAEREMHLGAQYVSAESELHMLEQYLNRAVNTVVNFPERDDTYEQLFGEGSGLYEGCVK